MTIHREGYKTSLLVLGFCPDKPASFYFISAHSALAQLPDLFSYAGRIIITYSFFRVPDRKLTAGDNLLVCPADGKVVVIEEYSTRIFQGPAVLQISIFMSRPMCIRTVTP